MKKLVAFALLVVLTCGLVGCGGGTTTPTGAKTPTGPTAPK